MYVELELGWMAHPFPTGSFRIASDKQIETIRGLGLKRVRCVPRKSDPAILGAIGVTGHASAAPRDASEKTVPVPDAPVAAQEMAAPDLQVKNQALLEEQRQRTERSARIAAQQHSLSMCEQQFGEAVRQYRRVIELQPSNPQMAREQCQSLINSYMDGMMRHGESAIRLLSDGMGDRASLHPVNVTVIALLLGKAMGLSRAEMHDLGMAAFLHDCGKLDLPDRVRWLEENFSTTEYKMYQEHVALGLVQARRMALSEGALAAIAQHHEMIDGSGFPGHIKGERLAMPAKILALVNRYDNLCNPSRPVIAMTPHEAISLIFAQMKTRFDSVALSAFIRMMGVYPPGSVIELVDGRYAMVVSVNSSRPLKPRIIVHDPAVPRHEALIMDLEKTPGVGIRRSLKPASLPRAAMDYLSPRQRICYFFERAVEPGLQEIAS